MAQESAPRLWWFVAAGLPIAAFGWFGGSLGAGLYVSWSDMFNREIPGLLVAMVLVAIAGSMFLAFAVAFVVGYYAISDRSVATRWRLGAALTYLVAAIAAVAWFLVDRYLWFARYRR